MRQRVLSFGAQAVRSSSIFNIRVQLHGFSRLHSTSPTTPGLFDKYNSLIRQGVLQQDVQQHKVVEALDNLLHQMAVYDKDMELYHAQLREWEIRREELRQKLLLQEAEKQAQRQVQKKLAERKNSLFTWLYRWCKQMKQRLLTYEAEKEKQWQVHVYGHAASELFNLRKRRPSREIEAGAGRMVSHFNREKKLDQLVGPRPSLPASPKGLYIYGSVGCGKTMLMDMFYNAADGVVQRRRRLHFHAALLEVHDWMHKLWKKEQEKKAELGVEKHNPDDSELLEAEPVALDKAMKNWLDDERRFQEENSPTNVLGLVAEKLILNETDAAGGGACLLCFDELQVVDVFTAVALAGIFTALIKRGAIIVVTSNRAPSDLNKEGMQKEIFNKFIAELHHHCQLILLGSETDYRRLLAGNEKSGWENYFWPLDKDAHEFLEVKWQRLVSEAGGKIVSATIPVMFGRTLEVPQSCHGVARFTFAEICDRPVGAADYIALARHFHTVFVTGIPVMSMRNRDKARRFITLVDELYNHRRQMICTAASSIDELFLGSEEGSLVDLESVQFETEAENSRLRRDVTLSGSVAPVGGTKEEKKGIQLLLSGREELFAFQRAVSRLIEMQSPLYLQGHDFQAHQGILERATI